MIVKLVGASEVMIGVTTKDSTRLSYIHSQRTFSMLIFNNHVVKNDTCTHNNHTKYLVGKEQFGLLTLWKRALKTSVLSLHPSVHPLGMQQTSATLEFVGG
jgi:hypothetical protein